MKAVTHLLRWVPFLGSVPVERAVLRISDSRIATTLERRAFAPLERLGTSPVNVLVVADVNAGDSILLAPAPGALARSLPAAEIDYMFHHKTADLLASDPALRRTFPVLRGSAEAASANREAVRRAVREHSHDLVVNFCPFVTPAQLGDLGCPVITPLPMVIAMLQAYRDGKIASLPYQAVEFATEIVRRLPGGTDAEARYTGTSISVPVESIQRVRSFLADIGNPPPTSLVLYNPDTSNYSTFLGNDLQAAIVDRLLRSPDVDRVILSRGFEYRGVEDRIVERLAPEVRARVVLCPPALSFADLAALVDRCGVYAGGDTGPLHVAAARKTSIDGLTPLHNRTAVVGIFKATDPRIYGYSSTDQRMIDSSQDAPAAVVEAAPPCKNLTCSLQRITASCPAPACQDALDADAITDVILQIMSRAVGWPGKELAGSRCRADAGGVTPTGGAL